MINPYHVQVRKKLKKEESEEIEANDAKGGEGENQDEENQRKTSEQQHYVKMSLQLYQVVGQCIAEFQRGVPTAFLRLNGILSRSK